MGFFSCSTQLFKMTPSFFLVFADHCLHFASDQRIDDVLFVSLSFSFSGSPFLFFANTQGFSFSLLCVSRAVKLACFSPCPPAGHKRLWTLWRSLWNAVGCISSSFFQLMIHLSYPLHGSSSCVWHIFLLWASLGSFFLPSLLNNPLRFRLALAGEGGFWHPLPSVHCPPLVFSFFASEHLPRLVFFSTNLALFDITYMVVHAIVLPSVR